LFFKPTCPERHLDLCRASAVSCAGGERGRETPVCNELFLCPSKRCDLGAAKIDRFRRGPRLFHLRGTYG
jgi:hypothetical protein